MPKKAELVKRVEELEKENMELTAMFEEVKEKLQTYIDNELKKKQRRAEYNKKYYKKRTVETD